MKYYIINHSDNGMESHQPSLDRSDDNFNFNDDYDDDVQSFSRCPFSYFVFYYDF